MLKVFLEIASLPFVYLLVLCKEKIWQMRVEQTFYSHRDFHKLDQYLLQLYQKKSPFYFAKAFSLQKKESNLYTFGMTPLHVYEQLLKRWIQQAKGSYLELGSGTGRGLVFFNAFSNLKTYGVEVNPYFVTRTQQIIESFRLDRMQVVLENYLTIDDFNYDWIYLYEFFLSDEALQTLCAKIYVSSKTTTKIITVSYSLAEYDERFVVEDSFSINFSWGKAQVFLNAVKSV